MIKQITKNEINVYVQLRSELWPKSNKEELMLEAMNQLADKEHTPAFIAYNKESDVVGFIELSIHTNAPGCQTRKIAFIEGWYIKKQYQHLGYGKALVKVAENWAQSKGITEMASDTNDDYPISPIAHKAVGFKESYQKYHYYKNIIAES